MRRVEAILCAALTIPLAGCFLRAKQPPAPPVVPAPMAATRPLSEPQTKVELPRSQPVDPDALATSQPVTETPAAAPPAGSPSPPSKKSNRPPAPATATVPPPKPDTPPPPVEAARPPIQEIVAPGELQQLQRSAQEHKRQTRLLIDQAQTRRLTADERALVQRINQFMKLSDDEEKAADMRSADELAGRAHILAKGLLSGK
jgi:hypothetical protein